MASDGLRPYHEPTDEPSIPFEEIYRRHSDDPAQIPWVELRPQPFVVSWVRQFALRGAGQHALVVGCGLGDDAAYLARRGFEVVAFDISPTAIAAAKERFPDAAIQFECADLFDPPTSWSRRFDFVLEVHTVQALPPDRQGDAMAAIGEFVRPGGRLLCLADERAPGEARDEGPPWPLSRSDLASYERGELQEVSIVSPIDRRTRRPTRKLRGLFSRPL